MTINDLFVIAKIVVAERKVAVYFNLIYQVLAATQMST